MNDVTRSEEVVYDDGTGIQTVQEDDGINEGFPFEGFLCWLQDSESR
jgi:hypothetical protein